MAIGKSFSLKKKKDDAGIHKDFWSIQGDFIYRHHIEPRVQFFVSREESCPIPLSKIDVISATYADLEIAQENEFRTIGMSTRKEICQIRERVSQDLRY